MEHAPTASAGPRSTVILTGTITTPSGVATSKTTNGSGKNKHQALPRMDGYEKPLCVLPGSGLAGAIRRALRDDIIAGWKQSHGEDTVPFRSVFGFYCLSVGGVGGLVSMRPGEETALRRVNPLLSVFGKAGLAGRIGIASAVAIGGKSVIGRSSGYRGDDVRRTPELIELFTPEMIREYKALRIGGKSAESADLAVKFLKDGDRSALDKIERLFDGLSDAQGDEADDGDVNDASETKQAGSDKGLINIQNPYGGYEFFLPGTAFRHQIALAGMTPVEMAFSIGALWAFARRPRLGGHWRDNLGWIDVTYTAVRLSDDPLIRGTNAGTVTIRSRTQADGEDVGITEPAFEVTGELKEFLDHYLRLREAGFPDMDFEAGADGDRASIKKRNDSDKKVKRAKKAPPVQASQTAEDVA